MTPARFRWGLLFIAVGVLLLLTQSDYLGSGFWFELIRWWPVLLIAIGLEKIFVRSRFEIISYLTSVVLVLSMAYVAIEARYQNTDWDFADTYYYSRGEDQEIKATDAVIDHGEADLRVYRSRDDIISARFRHVLRKPDIDFTREDDGCSIKIVREKGGSVGYAIFHDRRSDPYWTINFSENLPLKLDCFGYRSSVNLNMTGIPLRELKVNDDRGDIYVKVGSSEPDVRIDIGGDRATLSLRLPENSGLLTTGGRFSDYLKGIGLTESEDRLTTQGFDSAAVRVSLDVDDNLESLSIDYY